MNLLNHTLTDYFRGLMLAGLILGIPFVLMLAIDTIKQTLKEEE